MTSSPVNKKRGSWGNTLGGGIKEVSELPCHAEPANMTPALFIEVYKVCLGASYNVGQESSWHWLTNENIHDFTVPSFTQITQEAKEAIHIRRLDPSLNRNIGAISIPHCFDHLVGAKPKHPWVNLSQTQDSVNEVAQLSQIPGLNLTQFNSIGTFRSNIIKNIPKCSNRACRAKTYLIRVSTLTNFQNNRPALYHLTWIK